MGRPARRSARSKALPKSRWLVKRIRPRLAYLIRSRWATGSWGLGTSVAAGTIRTVRVGCRQRSQGVLVVEDRRSGGPASWVAVLTVVAVVLLTVIGGYAYVEFARRPSLNTMATVRAYVEAQSESDCDALANLSTDDHFDGVYCPPPDVRGELEEYALEVAAMDVRRETSDTATLLADVTVTLRRDGTSFTTEVVYTLVRDGDRWLVDEGRDPRPLLGDREVTPES